MSGPSDCLKSKKINTLRSLEHHLFKPKADEKPHSSSIGLVAGAFYLTSCGKEKSSVTGWNYNDPKMVVSKWFPDEQETGPGLVLVEGGTFTMGPYRVDVTIDWNNIPRRSMTSVPSDEIEVANIHYLEYHIGLPAYSLSTIPVYS